jgi:hypothetical protein
MHDRTSNLPPMPGIFPDNPAPFVRNGADGHELVKARWGLRVRGAFVVSAGDGGLFAKGLISLNQECPLTLWQAIDIA